MNQRALLRVLLRLVGAYYTLVGVALIPNGVHYYRQMATTDYAISRVEAAGGPVLMIVAGIALLLATDRLIGTTRLAAADYGEHLLGQINEAQSLQAGLKFLGLFIATRAFFQLPAAIKAMPVGGTVAELMASSGFQLIMLMGSCLLIAASKPIGALLIGRSDVAEDLASVNRIRALLGVLLQVFGVSQIVDGLIRIPVEISSISRLLPEGLFVGLVSGELVLAIMTTLPAPLMKIAFGLVLWFAAKWITELFVASPVNDNEQTALPT